LERVTFPGWSQTISSILSDESHSHFSYFSLRAPSVICNERNEERLIIDEGIIYYQIENRKANGKK
jgi:hypothetical protein